MGKSVIFIPARMDSKRLPGKPLIEVGGKAMVQWTYERAKETKADYVFVVSSDDAIVSHCISNDILLFRTDKDHSNGTSRCLEAWETFKETRRNEAVMIDVIINLQCDEPLIDPLDVDLLIESVISSRFCNPIPFDVCTLACSMEGVDWQDDKDVVKAAVSEFYRVLWFSRDPLTEAYAHVGIYGFYPTVLEEVGKLRPSPTAIAHSLEQMTWLMKGFTINFNEVEGAHPLSINTEKDLEEFRRTVEC